MTPTVATIVHTDISIHIRCVHHHGGSFAMVREDISSPTNTTLQPHAGGRRGPPLRARWTPVSGQSSSCSRPVCGQVWEPAPTGGLMTAAMAIMAMFTSSLRAGMGTCPYGRIDDRRNGNHGHAPGQSSSCSRPVCGQVWEPALRRTAPPHRAGGHGCPPLRSR